MVNIGFPIFLIVAMVIVYRSRSWRLVEFMFVMIAASIVPSFQLRWLIEERVAAESIASTMLPLTCGCYGFVVGGAAIGLRYVDALQIEATLPRMLLIVFGMLMAVCIPALIVVPFLILGATIESRRGSAMSTETAVWIMVALFGAAFLIWLIRSILRQHIKDRQRPPP